MDKDQFMAEFMRAYNLLEFEPDGYGIKFSDQNGRHIACMIRDRKDEKGIRVDLHVGPGAVPCTAPPDTEWLT